MKKYLLILLLALSFATSHAQETNNDFSKANRYILIKDNLTAYNMLRLDTSTGKLYHIEWDVNCAKTKSSVFTGCPNIEASLSYNGRFSIVFDKSGGQQTFLMIDHKCGDIWQIKHPFSQHTLVKVLSAE